MSQEKEHEGDKTITLKYTSRNYSWEIAIMHQNPEEAITQIKEVDALLFKSFGVPTSKTKFRFVD
jgi:hypothetical protein